MPNTIRGDDQDNFLHGTTDDDILLGLGGNDVLMGREGNDTLDGGAGDDMLHGDRGNNTYLFGRGDGNDRIMSFDPTSNKHNMIRFGEGLTAQDILVQRDGMSLRLSIAGTQDSIFIDNYFQVGYGPDEAIRPFAVEEFRFFDGTSWDHGMILAQLAPVAQLDDLDNQFWGGSADGKGGNDQLEGGWMDDLLLGGAGDDILHGMFGDDVLVGGSGNDLLHGGDGANTFQFGQGWGQDTIVLTGMGGVPRMTVIELDAVLPGSLQFRHSDGPGLDLVISLKGGTDSITIAGYFDPQQAQAAQTVRIQFADRTVWNAERIEREMVIPPGFPWVGTEGNDHFSGSWGDDDLNGAGGDDYLYGSGGNDLIRGGTGNDELDGADGNDLLHGGEGDDFLRGGEGDDTLDGGIGNDHLDGGAGANLIRFGRDSGIDMLMTRPDSRDVVLLDAGVRPEDVVVSLLNEYRMVISIKDSGAQLSMPLFYEYPNGGNVPVLRLPLTLAFADGTVWEGELLRRKWFTGDQENNVISGTNGDDWMDGRGGDDMLEGRGGNDTLHGGDGNDHLRGEFGNDILMGGSGRDHLMGDEGDDTLRGGEGDDMLGGGNGNNTYLFARGDGIDTILAGGWGPDPSEQTVRFDASVTAADVQVRFIDQWGSTSLELTSNGGVDRIVVHDYLRTDGPDQVVTVRFADGTSWNGAELARRAFLGDDGDNHIEGTAGDETLDGQGGGDMLFGHQGNDILLGGAGKDVLDGGEGNDIYHGGSGDDLMIHGFGDDTFLFNQGDGADIVNYSELYPTGSDVFRFGEGILRENVSLYRHDNTLWIKYGINDSIQVNNLVRINGEPGTYNIDRFEFANGESFSYRELSNHAPEVHQRMPPLMVREGEVLEFAIPAGMFVDPDQGDVLTYKLSDKSGDLPSWLTFDPQTGTLICKPGYQNAGEQVLILTATDQMGLSAQTTFSIDVAPAIPLNLNGTANADVLTGNVGNDTLNGLGGNDILDGSFGADRMAGGSGDDVYHVDNAGDVVVEYGSEGVDLVYSSISHTLGANVERVTLTGTGAVNATGNSLNNVLTGNSGANVLNGGGGADSMAGGAGNDTYVVDNGSDVVSEAAGAGIDRVMSSVGRTLGANQEVLTLTGTTSISGYGNTLNNLIQGNSGINSLNGGEGHDILQGAGGNDTLSDGSAMGNVFDGGDGADRLSGGAGRDLYIGGAGADTITTGSGADVIAFNRGDGQDTVTTTAGTADNTVSLGHGILYADLALAKVGTDLILQLGEGEQISFKGWYGSNGRTVATLQVMTEGGDYEPGALSTIQDHKVEQFNFSALVTKFDNALAAQPTLTSWNLAPWLTQSSSGGSDSAAIGGDLAYHYATDDALSALGTSAALEIIGSPQFGTGGQALQAGSALNDGTPLLY